jgi:hypothetical protein
VEYVVLHYEQAFLLEREGERLLGWRKWYSLHHGRICEHVNATKEMR